MGHRHTKEEILEGALAAALEEGLSQLTFGRLAKHLGINDRTIVYYFPTKEDLIGDVLVSMGLRLQNTLAKAFTEKAENHVELLRAAWPVLAKVEHDPIFSLFFEASGLALTRREPYVAIVPMIVEAWIEWTSTYLTGTAKQRQTEAETAIAVLDGLLLIRLLSGPAAAQRVARRLGVA
jgi:AcrR family transcriptional regulator